MKLATKITLSALCTLVAGIGIVVFLQGRLIHEVSVDRALNTMRTAVLQAEATRAAFSALADEKAYDYHKLREELEGLDSIEEIRQSTAYKTIPIVAAWRTLQESATNQNYTFRVPKHSPRNPDNEPTAFEAEILHYLKTSGEEEYTNIDKSTHTLTYARPIVLTADCLSCHGNPANSPTGDGKDALGFAMEGWKEGEIHGAFILQADTQEANAVAMSAIYDGLGSILLWVTPFFILILVGYGYFNRRYIIQPLNRIIASLSETSQSTGAAANEMKCASENVASGASEQASSLEETSASLEELTSMTAQNAENATNVQQMTAKARASAEACTEQMASMNQAMGAIAQASQNISKIMKTVDEIAFQTNILALNAAVEAARAGSAGAGFAVVADEVRSLALRCSEAADETSASIKESIERSEEGARFSASFAGSLDGILEQIREVDTVISAIATATDEQATGLNQVNQAVTQLDQVTQTNAASAEESAAIAEEFHTQSDHLQSLVQELEVMIGGIKAQAKTQAALPASAQKFLPN